MLRHIIIENIEGKILCCFSLIAIYHFISLLLFVCYKHEATSASYARIFMSKPYTISSSYKFH